MMSRVIAGAAVLALGLGLSVEARAQGLQPGMRTMIQQGGIEPGPLLGAILPGEGYAPGFGFIPLDQRYDPYADPRRGYAYPVAYHDRRSVHRRRHVAKRVHRHHFAR